MLLTSQDNSVVLGLAIKFLPLAPLAGVSMNKEKFKVLFEATDKEPDWGL